MHTPTLQHPRRRLQTGVFPVVRTRASTVTPEHLAHTVRTLVEPSWAAVLVAPTSAMPAHGALASNNGTDASLTPVLDEWVGKLRQTAVVEVPQTLRRTLMGFRALFVPIATPVLHLGGIVLPAVDELDVLISTVEDHACDFALRLELVQRDQFLAALAKHEDDEAPLSSAPVLNTLIRTSFIPASRRSA